jgi:hypothetical protein
MVMPRSLVLPRQGKPTRHSTGRQRKAATGTPTAHAAKIALSIIVVYGPSIIVITLTWGNGLRHWVNKVYVERRIRIHMKILFSQFKRIAEIV